MATSLAVAVLMLAGKLGAYYVTGSTAILSDALESVAHMVVTAVVAFCFWYSILPADHNHPYGHGKIAYFSAGFEGALVLMTGIGVMYLGVRALLDQPELEQLGLGLAITAALAIVNLVLGIFLLRVGKSHNALILIANGKDVLTDMWTSAGVVAGVAIVWATGIQWIDPVVAILVGFNILVTAAILIRRSLHGLLDEADPQQTKGLLECLQEAVDTGILAGFHQLRHRQSNDLMWVEVHMLLPDEMTNAEAHRRVTTVERSVVDLFPDYTVHTTSHIEPASHESAHPGGHRKLGTPLEPKDDGMAPAQPEESGTP